MLGACFWILASKKKGKKKNRHRGKKETATAFTLHVVEKITTNSLLNKTNHLYPNWFILIQI